MNKSLETLERLIDNCSGEDRSTIRLYLQKAFPHPLEEEWGIDADTILTAIARSSDLTKRGVRGIIAEAVFVNEMAVAVAHLGWQNVPIEGDHPYDALLKKGNIQARIQVKLQRLERKEPKLYSSKTHQRGALFVVEVQKTRTGVKTAKKPIPGTDAAINATESVEIKTRPYSFGDFDILAVNLHPSSRDWRDFRYTVASWLLPRTSNQKLIEIFQPVAAIANDAWADNLGACLEWFESGIQRSVLPLRPDTSAEQELHTKRR